MEKVDKLERDVKAVMDAEGISQAQVAQQIGFSASILTQIFNGTYKGNIASNIKKIENWLRTKEIKAKARHLRARSKAFLETETARSFQVVFEEAQTGPDIGMITGAAGIGKTFTAKHYAENNQNVWVMTVDPSIRTPRAALKEVSAVVGVVKENGAPLFRSIVGRLKGTQGILIIDEAQHLSSEAIDQMRALHDQAEIGIVFVGNEPLKDRIEGYARLASHAQLFSRIGFRLDKKMPTRGDVKLILEGWSLEDQKLIEACEKMAFQAGALRLMEKVLRYAAKLASNASRNFIEMSDLKSSWSDLTGRPFPKIGGASNA